MTSLSKNYDPSKRAHETASQESTEAYIQTHCWRHICCGETADYHELALDVGVSDRLAVLLQQRKGGKKEKKPNLTSVEQLRGKVQREDVGMSRLRISSNGCCRGSTERRASPYPSHSSRSGGTAGRRHSLLIPLRCHRRRSRLGPPSPR